MTESLDLGIVDAPLLVFGGPYSNLAATRSVKTEAEALGIGADRVICTGDVVAYAAEPAETTDLVMDWGVVTVMGNCEESFGFDAEDCGCGFEEGTECDVLSRSWYAYADARLGAPQRAWMRGLPRTVTFAMAGRRFAVVHGSAASINEFVFEGSGDAVKRRDLDTLRVDAVIGGHSGVPFAEMLSGRLWLNAGVVGMPANDGTPRVWYALLTPETGGIRVDIRALDYDYGAAARAMRAGGLPKGYAQCLETGLWPNMDVMPAAEKAKAGRAIAPQSLFWPAAAEDAAD